MNRRDRLLLAMAFTLLFSVGLAAEVPVAVSPGSETGTVVGDACPTFSWGAEENAQSYELVVIYLLGEAGEEAEVVLEETVAGTASSWTPSLDRCLERGGQYAWSVRTVDREEVSEWSPPNLFNVASGPSEVEFEDALRVVREYLAAHSETEATQAEKAPPSSSESLRTAPAAVTEATQAEKAPPSSSESLRTAPAAVTEGAHVPTLLSVEGNVNAVSFTGDGSGLSGVPISPELCRLYGVVGAELPTTIGCKRVFVTSETYTGDLVTEAGGLGSPATGLEAGDLLCQDLADTAGLVGTFIAWLSDGDTDAKDRFSNPTTPWFNVDGRSLVAFDLTDLLDCGNPRCLAHPIIQSETGAAREEAFVWTGTDGAGAVLGTASCGGWTDIGSLGGYGINTDDFPATNWTSKGTFACDAIGALHLYCFQD